MIPNNISVAEVTSSLGDTEDFDMTVDLEALPHIMNLLTDVYSDEELACIREYSTNAWDAHVDAGNTSRPIEVTTPSGIAPFLKIKDYGIGMNKATIAEIYCKYGRSTKRLQTDTNGSMGIGGKAALAYASQFIVIGVKNGIKTEVQVSRRANGTGVMSVMGETKTAEPNGTEIIIPVKSYNNFEEKAKNFFRFWAEGTVLLDGKKPERNLTKMTDRIFVYDGDEDVVVMGNVAYPVESRHSITRNRGNHVAAFVTMNGDDEVVFVTSREELNYNPITTNALAGLREEYDAALKAFIAEQIQAAPNWTEAFKVRRDMNNTYGSAYTKDVLYKGEEIIEGALEYELDGIKRRHSGISYEPGRSRNAVSGGASLHLWSLLSAELIITGYKSGGVASAYKNRIKQYLRAQGKNINYNTSVYLVKEDRVPGGKWTENLETVSWKTIMAETKVEYTRSGGGFSYDGSYDVYDESMGYFTIQDIDTNDDIVFFTPKDHAIPSEVANRMLALYPDLKIVSANANRHGKLSREYPNAREYDYSYWMTLIGEADFDKLTEDDLKILEIHAKYGHGYYGYRDEYGLSSNKALRNVDSIDDPEYADAIRLYHTKEPKIGYAGFDKRYQKISAKWEKNNGTKFKKSYPLINWNVHPSETLAYVNMTYAANKKEN